MRILFGFYPGDHAAALMAIVLLQLTAVTAIGLLAARWAFRRHPASRAAWLVVALFCVLLSPPWTYFADRSGLALFHIATTNTSASRVAHHASVAVPSEIDRVVVAPTSRPEPRPATIKPKRDETQASASHPDSAPPRRQAENARVAIDSAAAWTGADVLRASIGWLAIAWALGFAWLTLRLVWGAVLVARLRRSATECRLPTVSVALEAVRRALLRPNLPAPRVSRWVWSPITVGLLRPVVLLPERLVESAGGRTVEDVLMHEYAHVVRWDHVVGFLQRVAGAVFWPHPLVHVLNRLLSQTREEICDNYVLKSGSDRIGYARTLVQLSETLSPPRPVPAGLGLLQPTWGLEERVAGLLDESRSPTIRAGRRHIALAALLLASTTAALAGTGRQLPQADATTADSPGPSVSARPSVAVPPAAMRSAALPSAKIAKRDVEAVAGALTLHLRLVDDQGKPLAGAGVALDAYGNSDDKPKWSFYVPFAVSDTNGDAWLRLNEMGGRRSGPLLLYALDAGRRLAAFQEVDQKALDQPIKLALTPACHVTGRLVSADFQALKRPISWTNVYLFRGPHRVLSFMSKRQEIDFLVPPGRYKLQAYGTHLLSSTREIEVKARQKELSLGELNLQADTLARLFGKRAPEFRNIKGWKNGKPVTLAQLRGKVVVLDFWGYWCGPCVFELPYWMTLHDDYAERGLVVIGIHDDSATDVADLDRKLASCRERQWWGRDVPYLVALDGGGKTRIAGTDIDARGATTAAYGITGFPTGVLIDRDGTLLGDFAPNSVDGITQLRRLLGLPPNPDPFVLTHRPAWRKRFDEHYRLTSGETLRHIPEPWIPERTQFITSRLNRYGGVGTFPDRIQLFDKPGTPPSESFLATSGDADLRSVLSSLAPDGSPRGLFDCPPRLAKLRLPGDWVVRQSAPLAERLRALEMILAAEFHQPIHFTLSKKVRETVVVRGQYKFQALPGAVDKSINWTLSESDVQMGGGGGSGHLSDFLGVLTSFYNRPFIDETKNGPGEPLSWSQRMSVVEVDRPKDPKNLNKVLSLLSRQTGLTFRIDRRPVDVWHVEGQN
jgi:beta-lactamase regulating signal transducer with metallopeptidase domain/thiol-disulfide isomerase/thioredoxin